MTTLDAIKNRTSYRGDYESTSVPRSDLEKIMEAGLAAPSGCNKQTTSLIAVDDPDVLAKVYDIFRPKGNTPPPAVICVLTQKLIAYGDVCFNVQDYSAAIQNILLAAVALGYQSCWYEGQVTGADEVGVKIARLLGVPEDYALVCLLPIGVAAQPVRYVGKKPFTERAWFNGFGG